MPNREPIGVRPEIQGGCRINKNGGKPEIVPVSPSNQFSIDKGGDRNESIYISKCKLGKNQLMDLNAQQQYHRNQVTSGKKNLLMSEDPLAASKSFAIQHSLANIEQMQKDIADSKMC